MHMLFPPTAFDLSKPEDWVALAARLAVGLLFLISGGYKLFSPESAEKMRKTLADAGIGAPKQTAVFVSVCEFVFGGLLTIGLATPLSAGVLVIISVVAMITVTVKDVEGTQILYRLSSFLYLPETLLIVLLAWVAVHGPTGASVDAALFANLIAH